MARHAFVLILCALVVMASCDFDEDTDDFAFAPNGGDEDDSWIDDLDQQVRLALDKNMEYLFSIQADEGYWEGKFITDTSVTANYILLAHYVELVDEARQAKAVNHILSEQLDDGSWNGYPGGPGVLDITVLDYFALKLAGIPADDPAMNAAKDFILANGGAESASELPQLMLMMFKQRPYNMFPRMLNTSIMLFEKQLYKLGYHHAMVIPMLLLHENYHTVTPPAGRDIAEIYISDPFAGASDKLPRKGVARQRVIDWILEHQEADGNWSGVFTNTMYCMMALKSIGDSAFDAIIAKGMEGVEAFQNEYEDTLDQQFSISPVMDTAYVIDVLVSAGADPTDPRIQKSVDWLISKEMRTYGDWVHQNPDGQPGGWSFEHHNIWYPDVDCSVIVLRGLSVLDSGTLSRIWDSVQRGIDWVITMQNDDGGFAAWDKNVIDLLALFPSLDNPWLMTDTSTADVSSRALTALSSLGFPGKYGDPLAIPRAVEYVRGIQEEPGYWWGRWGVNYVYGTGEALKGLMLAGENPKLPYIQKAVAWLYSVQNEDGGWGESPLSYEDEAFAGIGESTAAQTAYVLTGLIYAGEVNSKQVTKGIQFLLDHQLEDGSWVDTPFMGTNIVREWYARYDMASIYKPGHTLAQYLEFKQAGTIGK